MSPLSQPVLLFDGDCGLCHACVRFLLRQDKTGRLRFAALQSPIVQAFLREQGLPTEDFETLVFVPDWGQRTTGGYLLRTEGVLAACAVAGGRAGWLAKLSIVPRRWRDAAYRALGRSRFRLFGIYRRRPLENPEWEQRFIDGWK